MFFRFQQNSKIRDLVNAYILTGSDILYLRQASESTFAYILLLNVQYIFIKK